VGGSAISAQTTISRRERLEIRGEPKALTLLRKASFSLRYGRMSCSSLHGQGDLLQVPRRIIGPASDQPFIRWSEGRQSISYRHFCTRWRMLTEGIAHLVSAVHGATVGAAFGVNGTQDDKR